MSKSPYDDPAFYTTAIAEGRHRDIVGGRWAETGEAQMIALLEAGLQHRHHLLDIGAGSLRLGCRAVDYLDPGHYWATDASREMLLAGHRSELSDPARLDPAQLIGDAEFRFPGVSEEITHAIAFAVFPHLPVMALRRALINLRRFPKLQLFMFTVFLAPDAETAVKPYRQRDGVVTHDMRVPYHVLEGEVRQLADQAGWDLTRSAQKLPRGQVLFLARPLAGSNSASV